MFVFYLWFFFYILGLIYVSFFRFSFLLVLLCLEFVMFSLYFGFTSLVSVGFGSVDFLVLFIVMVVVEGAFGLCLLVGHSRFSGGDYFSFYLFV